MSGVELNNIHFDVEDGSEGFTVATILGLLDGVDVRHNTVYRSGDGAFPSETDLSERIVTMAGLCHTSDSVEQQLQSSNLKTLQRLRDGFIASFDLGYNIKVWGKAFVSDKPNFVPEVWGDLAKWDLELQFDDPYLFGDLRTSTATPNSILSVYHMGNVESFPTYTVQGNFPNGYSIAYAGKKFEVTRAVTAGNPHVIDMEEGYVRIGGSMIFGAIGQADLWPVEPGAEVDYTFSASGGATGSITAEVWDRHL